MFTGGCSDVRIWDMNSPNPQCKRLFDCLSPVNAVCLHPNQVELAIGAQNGGVYLWDVKSDKHEQLIPEVDTSIQDVAISPNSQFMAAVNNKVIKINIRIFPKIIQKLIFVKLIHRTLFVFFFSGQLFHLEFKDGRRKPIDEHGAQT
jgi:WD40 repeat protein